jgi:hypothetical protein
MRDRFDRGTRSRSTINRRNKEITALLHVIRKKFTVRSQLSGYASTRGVVVALASRRFTLGIKTKGRTEKEKIKKGSVGRQSGVHDMALLCFFVSWKKTTRRRKKVHSP